MKITTRSIKKLNPCRDRFNNFTNYYPKFSGTLGDFLSLENITYSDKIWVATKILSRNQLVHWSIACAESVSYIFNKRYPNNKSVSNLLGYIGTIKNFDNVTKEQRNTILKYRDAAAYDADAATYAAYTAAAYAAYTAAAYAAYAADAAAAYVAYAAYAAADAAAAAAYAAAYAYEEQHNLNLLFLSSLEEE